MAVILGIDTGGTYTDSVLVDPVSRRVLRKAKAFTTREDLLRGIEESLARLSPGAPDGVALVCLSTTLATNAVVEGQGGRVGVLLLGHDPGRALPAARVQRLRGRLDIKGRMLEDIDPAEVRRVSSAWAGQVDAVAVSGFASVRNPAHEKRVRELVRETLDVPVVCAHELSSALGLHERTVTAALNAALIPCICELTRAVRRALAQRAIDAPLMLVKGDGSLMGAEVAQEKPIETVLSGPAASIVGGLFLSGVRDALLVDMGGTTSDFAQVADGRAVLSGMGAEVGGWHTQLRAAKVATFGAGGDSRLRARPDGTFAVGPQRVVPLCVAARRQPGLAAELRRHPAPAGYALFEEQPCECYRFLRPPAHRAATETETRLFALLADGPHSLFYLAQRMERDAEKLGLDALVREGVLQRCGLTPTDLLHIRGDMRRWDADAARAGAEALAAYRGLSPEDLVSRAFTAVQAHLRRCCIQACAGFAGATLPPDDPAARFFLDGGAGLLRAETRLTRPLVALGAPAHAWMPDVGRALGTEVLVPEHAEVASAVGAAAGQVLATAEALVRPDQYHKGYLVHAAWGNPWFERRDEAEAWAKDTAEAEARAQAARAGAGDCTARCTAVPAYSQPLGGGPRQFIETKIAATVLGSPQWKE